jgi:hypothetical protein
MLDCGIQQSKKRVQNGRVKRTYVVTASLGCLLKSLDILLEWDHCERSFISVFGVECMCVCVCVCVCHRSETNTPNLGTVNSTKAACVCTQVNEVEKLQNTISLMTCKHTA